MKHTHCFSENGNTLENQQVLLGYFYLRLLTSNGSYIPTLSEITTMSFKYLTRPSQVFDLYEKAAGQVHA